MCKEFGGECPSIASKLSDIYGGAAGRPDDHLPQAKQVNRGRSPYSKIDKGRIGAGCSEHNIAINMEAKIWLAQSLLGILFVAIPFD